MQRLIALFALAFALDTPAATPDLVQNPHGRAGLALDGAWSRIVDPYENGYYNHRWQPKPDGYFISRKPASPADLVEYDFAASPKLNVPGDWNSQEAELFLYEGTVWYHREFRLERRPAHRYRIHFGAVNYTAQVWINGRLAGAHEGGFTPFQFDITDLLVDGANFVVVKADNRRAGDQVPTVNTDWWNYGGITRPVRIIELPERHVADYALEYGPEGRIEGWIRASGAGLARLVIPELAIDHPVELDSGGHGRFSVAATPRLWSPEQPYLYDVELVYGPDTVTDRVGFRRLEVAGTEILLNGKPLFLRGISLHEEAPGGGRAWSEAHARRLLGWAQELGCNFVRLAHYPHNEAMTRLADEMGLLVWSEIPVYWTVDFADPAVYAKAEAQLAEMITRDRNRASIALWSIANETPATPERTAFLQALAEHARRLDPGRLVTAALDTQRYEDDARVIDDPLAAAVDVIGINSYCGWYGPDRPQDCRQYAWRSPYGKPVIMSEFGAGALQGRHGPADHRWTEEYQAAVYEANLAMIGNIDFLRGLTPWILMDFRSPRRPLPGIQDYWNRKGLLSETGAKKAAWHVLQAWYADKASQQKGSE
jgi:beta-glucuronidase